MFINDGSFTGTLQLNGGSQFSCGGIFSNQGSILMTATAGAPCVFQQNYQAFDNEANGEVRIGQFCRFELAEGSYGNENAGTIINEGTLSCKDRITNEGTITNDGTYYGGAVTGGTVNGANAAQVTGGNPEP